jgi:hypothetical protein
MSLTSAKVISEFHNGRRDIRGHLIQLISFHIQKLQVNLQVWGHSFKLNSWFDRLSNYYNLKLWIWNFSHYPFHSDLHKLLNTYLLLSECMIGSCFISRSFHEGDSRLSLPHTNTDELINCSHEELAHVKKKSPQRRK